ncbi:MAG: DUF3450 family protein [Planctomycetes bacterium]|nr:DUF3450 family protein [Planctomycetota bacterium]
MKRQSDCRRAGRSAMVLGHGVAAAGILVLGLVGLGLATAATPAGAGADVDETRTVLEKWVETRRVIAETQREWAVGCETLNDQIGLLEQGIKGIRDKIAEAQKNITEADKSREALVAENDQLKTTAAALAEAVTGLEARMKALLPRLPDKFRDHVSELTARLPEDQEKADKMSLSVRFQNVVGVLNEANKFNRQITVEPEVRTFPDGTQVAVTTMYLGVGQAYYVSANAAVAGFGTIGDEGWIWTPANEIGPQVAQAIAILKNEQVASFVKLPITIK